MSKRPPAAPFISKRLAKLREAMAEAKVASLLVTYYPDVSYLTGFEGDDSYLLLTEGRETLISDTRYEEQIQREAPWLAVAMRKKNILEETAKLVKKAKIEKLGVQSEAMTLRQKSSLLGFFKKSKPKLKPVSDIVVNLRHIKDAEEIAITEKAIRIAEGAFEALRPQIRPGMMEGDIAGLLGYEMRKRGALNSSFDTIVGAGANGSLPHYRPGAVALENDSALLVDWGARAYGYCSDLTRVVFAGKVNPKIAEIYKVVLEAQMAAIAAIKPGMKGKKVDRVARDIIEKAGYGKQFGHGLGHGLGRDIHEAISLSKYSKTVLKPGMIVTVEPGIYLPGVGGVRIEDDILVTETGCRVLSSLPKDLAWAQLG